MSDPEPRSAHDAVIEFLQESDELLKDAPVTPPEDWEAYMADIARRAQEFEESHMTERPTYHATATRDGEWYAVKIHDLPPGLAGATQGRDLDDAESMAREAIALLLEVDEDSFDLVLIESGGES